MCIAMFATFASCDKNEVEVISNGEREVTIHATIDPSTKTEYTDDKLFTWQLTDVLRVFSTNSSLDPTYKWDKFTASSVSGSSAEFTGKITSGYTPYEVLCPGAANYGKNGDGSAIGTIILSKALDYTSVIGSNLPLYAKVPDGVDFSEAELVFKPVCGLIKVTYNNAPLTAGKFVITSSDSPLAGTFQLSEGLISGTGATATSNSVTVSFNQLDNNGKLEFFIPAVATTYGSGLSIELQTPDGVTIEGTKKTSKSALEVVNGRFSRVATTLPDIASVYITTSSTLVGASTTSFDIDFSASSNWTASSTNTNFILSSASGTAGHKTITVTFPANTTASEVASTITITSGSDSKSITLTQEADVVKKELSFDFTSDTNISGWPKSETAAAEATDQYYSLEGKSYTFALGAKVFFNSSYLMLKSTTYLGLPAIDGWKLSKIVISNTSGCSTATKVSVYKEKTYTNLVTGGGEQTFSTQGSTYTYALSGTEVNTSYYLKIANKNCQIKNIKLTYIQ